MTADPRLSPTLPALPVRVSSSLIRSPARSKNIEPDVVRVPAEAVAHSLDSHVVAEDTPVDHGAEPVVGHRQPISRRQGLVWVNSELLLEEVVNRVDLDSRLESGIVRPLPHSHPGIPNVASIDVHRVAPVREGQMLHGKRSDCLRSRLEVFLLQEEHDPRSPVVVHGHLCVESQHIRPTSEDGGRVAHVRRVCLKHRAHQVREESFGKVKTKDKGRPRLTGCEQLRPIAILNELRALFNFSMLSCVWYGPPFLGAYLCLRILLLRRLSPAIPMHGN